MYYKKYSCKDVHMCFILYTYVATNILQPSSTTNEATSTTATTFVSTSTATDSTQSSSDDSGDQSGTR